MELPDFLYIRIPIEYTVYYSLLWLVLLLLIGWNVATRFVRLSEVCKKYGIDEVDAFLKFDQYKAHEEVYKAAKSAWANLTAWVFLMVWLTVVGG